MSAYEDGHKRGRKYLQTYSADALKGIRLEEYVALGRVDAKQRYRRQSAQEDFMLAWYQVGISFATLFQTSDANAEKQMESIRSELERMREKVQAMLEWGKSHACVGFALTECLEALNDARSFIDESVQSFKDG